MPLFIQLNKKIPSTLRVAESAKKHKRIPSVYPLDEAVFSN
ncbi:hypothetical protein RV07_GL004087 [Enterococcus malodoratus]|nr:hypothetical protein RV07_GL004087 [Enterococcus malodoratus]